MGRRPPPARSGAGGLGLTLSRATLARVPDVVARPAAQPSRVGIVHFGPGAFHRAHQAEYVDRLLAHDPRWGIAAVALRSRGTVAALAAQDGLYTLAIRDAAPSYRVLGAHAAWLGPGEHAATMRLLADPAVALVTATVTEKGYCLAANGSLDLAHPDIAADLAGGTPRSLIGWLVTGLAARRSAGVAPFVPMPCDNLADNGAKLHAALVAFARVRDPALADWIAGEVRIPATMVDAITPASDDALRTDVAAVLGVADAIPVQREAFAQWVIEDIDRPLGPDLAGAGAIVTRDVAGYERAKLGLLNGAHSALAYLGLARGHASVAEAIGDPALARFVEELMRVEIAPVLPRVAGLDLDAYRAALLARFRNPALVHRLEQIATDGTQKLPQRYHAPLAAHRTAGRMPARIVAALGAWAAFLIVRSRAGRMIDDPAGDRLARLAADGDAAALVDRLIDLDLGFARWMAADHVLVDALRRAATRALAGPDLPD